MTTSAESADGQFALTIEGDYASVWAKQESAHVLRRARLPGFHKLASKVFLVNGGRTIVVVRRDHQVVQLNHVALYVVRESGDVLGIPASRFTTKLVRQADFDSVQPHQRWLESVVEVTDDSIVVVNAEGERRTVKLDCPR